ncbi:MAG: hypothetical protein QOI83_924, partial [Streptomycetaceae bacterium]|nr:hypothetical protein [Streptomycetaceae bacterium]
GWALDWRVTFLIMTALTIALLAWITTTVPDHPGQRQDGRTPMLRALRVPGVSPILFVTLFFVQAHTILYTYIATFLDRLGTGDSTDLVLLVFGSACLVSIWVVGVQPQAANPILLVAAAAAILAVLADSPALVYVAVTLWGLGWGGAPTLLQTAVGDAGGDSADAAQPMLVTLWNVAMAGGGVVGGLLLDMLGSTSFPWSVLALLAPVLVVVAAARTHGFPAKRASTTS